jgi:hypothetical protein
MIPCDESGKTLGVWIHWNPIKEMNDDFYIDSYNQNFKGLLIELSGKIEKNKKLRIFFRGSYVISMVTNETFRTRLGEHFRKNRNTSGLKGPLFKVEDSEYMRYLSEESYSFTDAYEFKHYFIEDEEWNFDVASIASPQIELFIDEVLVEKIEEEWHMDLKKKVEGKLEGE